jgi:hypothetical protein
MSPGERIGGAGSFLPVMQGTWFLICASRKKRAK